jgi:SAM-dependent methyltransferase
MLERLEERFANDPSVEVVRHDLDAPLPAVVVPFDAVVSSFAIHHLTHARKRSLYVEIFDRLAPGGVFCNLEHVASATASLHVAFLGRLGIDDEDPSNKLARCRDTVVVAARHRIRERRLSLEMARARFIRRREAILGAWLLPRGSGNG